MSFNNAPQAIVHSWAFWAFWTTTNLRIYPDKRNPNDLKPIVRKPYAIKATPCGFQGSYLRLAKAFIEDPSQETVQLKE